MTINFFDDSVFVNFEQVHNRNERRVKSAIMDIVSKEGMILTEKDMQDTYALVMNRVPAHYVHKGTIVLQPNVSLDTIDDAVRDSLTVVLCHTKP